MRRVLLIVVAAAALAAPAAHAADTPSSLSVKATNAFFKGRLDVLWSQLHPKYRATIAKATFLRCRRADLASIGRLHVLKVEALTVETGTSAIAGVGTVPVAVVSIRITYTEPAATDRQQSVNQAFWTKTRGRWYAVFSSNAFYRAFRAGTCP